VTKKKTKYRSGLESALAGALTKEFIYEPYNLPYTTHRKYTPEGDTQKYKAIRDSMPEWELVFVLSNPLTKVRKGSKMTMSQWCEKEGFPCFTVKTSKELLKYVRDKKCH
jgi:hypothetical protein